MWLIFSKRKIKKKSQTWQGSECGRAVIYSQVCICFNTKQHRTYLQVGCQFRDRVSHHGFITVRRVNIIWAGPRNPRGIHFITFCGHHSNSYKRTPVLHITGCYLGTRDCSNRQSSKYAHSGNNTQIRKNSHSTVNKFISNLLFHIHD